MNPNPAPTAQSQAVQSFNEFTGNENDTRARRLLEMCNWDVQRAINVFYMPEVHQQLDADQHEPEIIEETGIIHPPPIQRVSHFARRREPLRNDFDFATGRYRAHQEPQFRFHEDQQEPEDGDSSIQVIGSDSNNDVQMLDAEEPKPPQISNGRAATQADVGGNDEVRAPIPAKRGIMLAQSFKETYQNGRQKAANPFFQPAMVSGDSKPGESSSSSSEAKGAGTTSRKANDFEHMRAVHRAAMDKYHQQKRTQRMAEEHEQKQLNNFQMVEAEADGATAQSTTGGFSQSKRRDLRILFRPPVDIIFFGDWDQALQLARQKSVWLLVNVQNSTEFSSAVLNRDIWSAETVKEVIKPNFLFWQVYHDSSDGARLRSYYGFDTFPVIFIVDPRTGEDVKQLQAPDPVTFLDNLTSFLARYPTFEARDQEFRQMATRGMLLPPSSNSSKSSIAAQEKPPADAQTYRDQMTSPVGKKRKQPGPSGGSSGDEQQLGYGGGLTPAENDENSREANRQAKKMKRVVTISDVDLDTQPSTSSTASASNTAAWSPANPPTIDPKEWRKWMVPVDSTQAEIPRVQLQFRLPDGRRQRVVLWAQAPLSALFSLIASLNLSPTEHMLILDHPRREFDIGPNSNGTSHNLLCTSLHALNFARQELVNVERRGK